MVARNCLNEACPFPKQPDHVQRTGNHREVLASRKITVKRWQSVLGSRNAKTMVDSFVSDFRGDPRDETLQRFYLARTSDEGNYETRVDSKHADPSREGRGISVRNYRGSAKWTPPVLLM